VTVQIGCRPFGVYDGEISGLLGTVQAQFAGEGFATDPTVTRAAIGVRGTEVKGTPAGENDPVPGSGEGDDG
jgi:hypothetical protein